MKRVQAFTLIEILVVIAIIAVVAALFFPVFARGKEEAMKTQDIEQMRQCFLGLQLYREDFADAYPEQLVDLVPRYVPAALITSPKDRRQAVSGGTYPAARFLHLPGEVSPRTPYKVSYAYLKAFQGRFPYPNSWELYQESPYWSVIACADYLYQTLDVSTSGPTEHGDWSDSGTFLRIRFDGSLRKAQKHMMGVSVGGSYDELFYRPRLDYP